MEKIDFDEKNDAEKLLRIILIGLINMRSQTLGRSEATLQFVSFVEQSLFMLYMKIYFSKD